MKILTICNDFISHLQFLKSCARPHGLCIEITMITLDKNIDSFVELLTRFHGMTNHYQNIQTLMTELFKVVHNLSPQLMDNFLTIKTIKYRSPQLCLLLPEAIRRLQI